MQSLMAAEPYDFSQHAQFISKLERNIALIKAINLDVAYSPSERHKIVCYQLPSLVSIVLDWNGRVLDIFESFLISVMSICVTCGSGDLDTIEYVDMIQAILDSDNSLYHQEGRPSDDDDVRNYLWCIGLQQGDFLDFQRTSGVWVKACIMTLDSDDESEIPMIPPSLYIQFDTTFGTINRELRRSEISP